MSSDLIPFAYEGAEVRSLLVDDEPWFVAADVARILGYRMASDMTRRLEVDDRGTRSVRTPSGDQDMTVISEPGLYVAVIGSQAAAARQFKRWITHEVIPSIRRTGAYATPAPAVDVSQIDRRTLAQWLIEAEDARAAAEAKVAELAPKAAVTENLLTTSGDYSVREAAQLLARDHGIATGQRRLFGFLRQAGWIDGRGTPYQRHIECGRLAVRIRTYDHPHTGEPTLAAPQVRITPKGLVELHRLIAGGGKELVPA
jgi:anti-repressor protein